MQRAAFIYNPIAGPRRQDRKAAVEQAAAVLRDARVATELVETRGPHTASDQAMEMIAAGCDTIIACGGDGTIHECMQQMVETRSPAALGVLPFGTGNALAADLRIPRDPAAAAHVLLRSEPRRIAVGRLEPETGDAAQGRYFIVTAGVGGDAHMLYSLNFETKQRHGMNAYYAQAAQIFLSHDFPAFLVEFDDEHSGSLRTEVVSQVLAVRISNFGGLIRGLAPGASLQRDDMRLVLFRTPRKSAFLFYMLGRLLQRKWLGPAVELVWAHRAICRPLPGDAQLGRPWPRQNKAARIYAEADGEVSGRLPVRLSSVPDALTLLIPSF